MVAQLMPEREFRGPGCSDACEVVKAIVPGRFGRSELLLHDPAAHESYGAGVVEAAYLPGRVLETGPLVVDLPRVEARVGGAHVQVTPIAMQILLVLARRAGEAVSSAEIVRAVWGSEWVLGSATNGPYHTVRVHVSRLRLALGLASDLIATVKGFGFRLETIPPGAVPAPRVRYSGKASSGRWAQAWERCACCGRTDRPHRAHGRCSRCMSNPAARIVHVGPCAPPPAAEDGAS